MIFKIIGWFLLAVLAIVIALLFVKVRVIAEYGINPTAKLKWLFLEIPLYPQGEKKPKKEKKKKDKKKDAAVTDEALPDTAEQTPETEAVAADTVQQTEETAETQVAAEAVQPENEQTAPAAKQESLLHMFYRCNNGYEGIIELLRRTVSYLGTFLGGFLRSVVVTEFYMDITVGTRDAAQTALKYGEICSAAFPLLGTIVSKYRIRQYDFNIEPDFMAYKSEYGMYVDLYVRPAVIIGIALALVFKLLFRVILKIVFNMLRPIIKQKAENKDKSKKKTEKSGATT